MGALPGSAPGYIMYLHDVAADRNGSAACRRAARPALRRPEGRSRAGEQRHVRRRPNISGALILGRAPRPSAARPPPP
eukprot:scaffold1626_cov372-Prasinococcus_capsulatus_cf.AAC.18